MMGKSERKANDGEERETNMRMMGKNKRQTCESLPLILVNRLSLVVELQ